VPGGPAGRVGNVGVWTGSRMLVWGGQRVQGAGFRGDGASFDPATDTWSPIPNSPLQPRSRAVGVWTGSRLLVWGGDVEGAGVVSRSFADGASFDPEAGRWSRLAHSPLGPRGLAVAVWTGTRLLIWGGEHVGGKQPTPAGGEEEEGGNLQSQGASYDPSTDSWRLIARSPLRGRARPRAVWTGREMIVWGGGSTQENQVAFTDGAAYDPATDTWRSIGSAPVAPGSRYEAVWTGKQMLVWGGPEGQGAAYDPVMNRWTPLPKSPLPYLPTPAVVWTGKLMLVWGLPETEAQNELPAGLGAAYDPVGRQWTLLAPGGPVGQGQTAVWTGSEMLVWGGIVGTGQAAPAGALRLGVKPA
jgi:hypothetical protein